MLHYKIYTTPRCLHISNNDVLYSADHNSVYSEDGSGVDGARLPSIIYIFIFAILSM